MKWKNKAKFIFWLINFVSLNPLDISKLVLQYLASQIDEYCIFGYEIVINLIKARLRRKNLEIGCIKLKS